MITRLLKIIIFNVGTQFIINEVPLIVSSVFMCGKNINKKIYKTMRDMKKKPFTIIHFPLTSIINPCF